MEENKKIIYFFLANFIVGKITLKVGLVEYMNNSSFWSITTSHTNLKLLEETDISC